MKTIIFDLDGTLVDLWPIERLTLAKTVNKKGALVYLDTLKRSGINNLTELYNAAQKGFFNPSPKSDIEVLNL